MLSTTTGPKLETNRSTNGTRLVANTGPALLAGYWADFHFGSGTSLLCASVDAAPCQQSLLVGKLFVLFLSVL
jgi:hypothetical protein